VTASVSFTGLTWFWPAAAMVTAALAALLWSYRSAPATGLRWVCVGLKALGVCSLAFCLLEPLWSAQRARPGANLFAIAADQSRSLEVKAAAAAQSRGELLRSALAPEADWQTTLDEHFEIRRFRFGARLEAAHDFAELTFDGPVTALGAALRGLAQRFAGQPLAGILLFTDGNATDVREAALELEGMPPVYPVVLGRPGSVRDLALAQVNVSQTVFEDAPVALQADVAAVGVRGETVLAQLTGPDKTVVEEQSLRVRRDPETLSFRFRFRPERSGLSFYRVRVGLRDERPASGVEPSAASSSQEGTLLNNTRLVPVDRGRGPHRVLYVAGRPNWEYKFLNRAVQADDQLQLVALLRVALREPKFEFRGRAGETGNPLFRGFGDQSREEVARYDQPVLMRLNTRDELELRAGFPRTPEELFGYEAVIVDDLEAAFFAPDQAALIQKFVSERGGGFLMLGGAESFQNGGYQRTPIGDLLPVHLDRLEPRLGPPTLKWALEREGWLQSWARLRDTEAAEASMRELMPPFHVFNRVRSVKPGASVIATAAEENGTEHPALVTQRYGRGRSAALMIGDFWRWGMRDAAAREDLDKAWRQLLRWLVADVPRPVELTVETPGDSLAGAVRLEVRARDPKFQPLEDAAVTVEVQPVVDDGSPAPSAAVRLRAEPSAAEPGLYEATYVARATGGYRATATVTNMVGLEVGQAQAGWSTDLAAEELQSLEPNVALLETIARRTGGEVVPMSELADFVRSLPRRQAPVMEAVTQPFWHTPWLFAFALACFVLEWGLRRWKGMP